MLASQQQPTGLVQGERPSRSKSKPKKEATAAPMPTSKQPNSAPVQQAACTQPAFDYLVPMNICVRSPPNQQQPQVDEQPLVECLSWALLDRLTGRLESSWCVRVASAKDQPASCQAAGKGCSLSEAIQQVDKSLEGKRCALVTCGPVPLRQHLHPIAKRLKVDLADHFGQYVDLLKEFDRCTFANNLTGRQVARASAATCGCCSLAASDSSAGCAHQRKGAACSAEQEKENGHSERVSSSGRQQAGDESAAAATPAGQQAQPQAQQHQPISQGSRKRFEEILKFLSISLEPAAKSKPVCAATLAGKQCNCSACSQALLQASCSVVERLLREGHSFNRLERIKRRVEVGLCETSAHEAEQRVVRARGLPWQASEQDIADFFTGLNIAKGGVGLCLSRQGRRNGEALIQFESREHRNLALSRHKHFMGNRYIEVYRASGDDFQSVAAGYNNKAEAFISKGAQFIVRMRGLPFTCTAMQVVDFFASGDAKTKACEVFAGEEGVLFVRNQDEKPTGDAFVLFATDEHARRAIAKHHQNIGTRYVELFRSTVSEVQQVLSVSMGPSGGGDEQAASSKQQASPASKAKQQQQPQQSPVTITEKNTAGKSPTSKSSSGTNLTSQLSSRSAFPALSEKPIAWQRPDAATYAQVAHSSRTSISERSPSELPQAVEAKSSGGHTSSEAEVSQEVAEKSDPTEAHEDLVADDEQPDSSVVVVAEKVDAAKSDESCAQTCTTESELLTTACEKLTLPSNEESSSGAPSTPHSPASSSAASSTQEAAPNPGRSPISSLCSSSEHSSTSNLSHKQAAVYAQHHNNNSNQPNHHNAGLRRYQSAHYHQQGRSSSRYQQNYVYHPTAAMIQQQQQQQVAMYSQELMQTSMQQHPASIAQTPYSTAHYPMAYVTSQSQSMAAGAFDPSQQLAHQHPPPPYSANSMQHQRAQQQVYAGSPAAHADPALMSRRDCIRLRGLPFEAQIDDVLHFLGKHSENILYQGVHMVYSAQGQPTGEAIIQMASCQAASGAAQEAHRRVMSVGKKQRYIEVIPSSIDDLKPTLGYGLAAFAASRAAAAYGMHPLHYAAYGPAGAQLAHVDPVTGYHHHHSAPFHNQQHQLPYMEPAGAECYSIAGADPATVAAAMASASSSSSETGVSPTPGQSPTVSSKQASDSEANSEEPVNDALPGGTTTPASEPQDTIQEAKETQSEGSSESRASMSSASSTRPITTTATSSSQPILQQQHHHHHHQLQQQQALMAAAQAAAYYPILYYYPPPQQPILASAAPTANRYH